MFAPVLVQVTAKASICSFVVSSPFKYSYQKPRLPIKIVAIILMTCKESNLKGKEKKG